MTDIITGGITTWTKGAKKCKTPDCQFDALEDGYCGICAPPMPTIYSILFILVMFIVILGMACWVTK